MASTSKSAQSNADLVRRWFREVWNEGRLDTIHELVARDATVHGLGEPGITIKGPAPVESFVTNMRSAFPDMNISVDQTVSEGDWVATRFTAKVTHKGNALGFPATGRRATVSGMSFIRIKDGRFVEAHNTWDQRGMLLQLGMPDPVSLIK